MIVEIGTGQARLRERIALGSGVSSFTIGRSPLADVVLDDDYAAPLHAAVDVAPDGRLDVRDLGSRNGVVVAGERVVGGATRAVPKGRLQIGRTLLHIRTSLETLAPEKPDGTLFLFAARRPRLVAALAVAAMFASIAESVWLKAPTDFAVSFASHGIAVAVSVGIWVAFWALLTRIMVGEWRWGVHTVIALFTILLSEVASNLIGLAGFSLSAPRLTSTGGAIVVSLTMVMAFYLHLKRASNITGRRAAVIVGTAFALFGSLWLWFDTHTSHRDVSAIQTMGPRIYPSYARLRRATPLEKFLAEPDRLRELADRKRDALPPHDGDDHDEGDDE